MGRLDGMRIALCGAPERLSGVATQVEQRGATAVRVEAGFDGEVDGAVICVPTVALDTPCCEWSADLWKARVIEPLRRTTVLVRELLAHWLSEGGAGPIVLVHVGGDDDAALVVRHGLDALARSVAKEYGRRGVRCNVVASERLAAIVMAPAFAFVTGQHFAGQS